MFGRCGANTSQISHRDYLSKRCGTSKDVMTESALVIGLGEVLWDMMPSGKVLGGAPANFAYMSNVLGERGVVASRVGNDALGCEARQAMKELGLDTSHVQTDDTYQTGSANVVVDGDGQPNFTIQESVAWDFMEWTEQWQRLSAQADVICYGSLAQRSQVSAATIERFLSNARDDALRVFDVNLRQSFFTRDVLRKSFGYADIAKINQEELLQLSSLFDLGAGTEAAIARSLLNEFDLKIVCLTRGDHGSLLVSQDKTIEHSGFQVKVVDAVGAGDAFTACLVHHFLHGDPLERISEISNRFAAWVVTQRGATPRLVSDALKEILSTDPDSDLNRQAAARFSP